MMTNGSAEKGFMCSGFCNIVSFMPDSSGHMVLAWSSVVFMPCLVILVSVLGLRSGRNHDRLQRTYFEGGFLAGENEGICRTLCDWQLCLALESFWSLESQSF